MLIKASRIRTSSGAGPLLRHLSNAEDNDDVVTIQGTAQDMRDAVADARRFGRTYSLRHWIIAPEIGIETDQFRDSAQAIADEFGFDIDAAFIVEHKKKRAVDGVADRHWHVVVAEVDPISGRVLDTRNNYARHEKVARVLEVAFGHPITAGRHDKAVITALRAEGRHDVADHLAASSTVTDRPSEAYTTQQQQQAKREGLDLPLLKGHVSAAWSATRTGHDFAALLAGHGLVVAPGDKEEVWVIRARDGTFIGAGHRLARVRRAEFHNRMESNNEHATAVSSPIDPERHSADQSPDGNDHGTGQYRDDADGRRAGFVHGDRRETARDDRRRDRREPEKSGSAASAFRPTGNREHAASHYRRGLIGSIQAAGRDLVALTRSPIGTGYNERVENAIVEVERVAQSKIAIATRAAEVSRTKLDAMIAFEKNARKSADELVARLRAFEAAPDPKPPSWLNQLRGRANSDAAPRREAEIAALRQEAIGAERVLRGAVSAVARAERDLQQAKIVASEKAEGAIKEARNSLDEARVTRTLLGRYPRLGFAGPAFVSWAGRRFYRGRKRYNVINPRARDIWGLPIDPGY